MNSGHIASNCTSAYICRKCNGKHHISICCEKAVDERQQKITKPSDSVVGHVGVQNNVLLQTAFSQILKSPSSILLNARILFDSGSQRSYITQSLRDKLKLQTVRTERLILRTFGHSESVVKTLDVVKLWVRHGSDDNFMSLEVICVPLFVILCLGKTFRKQLNFILH